MSLFLRPLHLQQQINGWINTCCTVSTFTTVFQLSLFKPPHQFSVAAKQLCFKAGLAFSPLPINFKQWAFEVGTAGNLSFLLPLSLFWPAFLLFLKKQRKSLLQQKYHWHTMFSSVSLQVIHDYPSIRQVNLICNTTNLGVVAPLGYNGLLILSCTFYAFKVLTKVFVIIVN